ncbi:unnamed protein product, partial [marine sediment metagenome]
MNKKESGKWYLLCVMATLLSFNSGAIYMHYYYTGELLKGLLQGLLGFFICLI